MIASIFARLQNMRDRRRHWNRMFQVNLDAMGAASRGDHAEVRRLSDEHARARAAWLDTYSAAPVAVASHEPFHAISR
jgi:hypothetical protein